MEDEILEQFKVDVAKFSGHYTDFLIIAKTSRGDFFWKATDEIWGVGAAHRYLSCRNEDACIEERELSAE